MWQDIHNLKPLSAVHMHSMCSIILPEPITIDAVISVGNHMFECNFGCYKYNYSIITQKCVY